MLRTELASKTFFLLLRFLFDVFAFKFDFLPTFRCHEKHFWVFSPLEFDYFALKDVKSAWNFHWLLLGTYLKNIEGAFTSMESCVLLHMGQLFEPSVAIRAFVGLFSSVHPYVLDQLVIRWKSLQTLLTLVGLHVPSGGAGPAPTWPAHATSTSGPSHASRVASRGCGSGRPAEVHGRSFCHQVLQR